MAYADDGGLEPRKKEPRKKVYSCLILIILNLTTQGYEPPEGRLRQRPHQTVSEPEERRMGSSGIYWLPQ